MTHYICTGSCHGVSDVPEKCGGQDCELYGQELQPCDCEDGMHLS